LSQGKLRRAGAASLVNELNRHPSDLSVASPGEWRRLVAIDQLRAMCAELADPWRREAATATFFEAHALPVVEANTATFAVLAQADSVYLRHRITVWPDDLELARIPGTDVWFLTLELEWGARVEYQFEIVRDGQWWRFNDPTIRDSPVARLGSPRYVTGPVMRYPIGLAFVATPIQAAWWSWSYQVLPRP
jgi:hypothetical protein